MDTVILWLLPLALAYLIGSLPLGAWLVRAASGFDPRDVNPHLLGVENVYKLVGPAVAVTSFTLDILKGLVAVMVGSLTAMWGLGLAPLRVDPFAGVALTVPGGFPGFFSAGANAPEALGVAAGMAFFGVILGHLHPLPLRGLVSVPRGRGNGVVVGALAALFGLGVLPFWLGALAIAVYAGVLALSGYVALASVAGSVALALGGVLAAQAQSVAGGLAAGFVAAALVLAWRHKAALSRINDGTEARLGAPRPRPEHGAVRLHGSPAHLRRRVAAALQSVDPLGGQAPRRARHPA